MSADWDELRATARELPPALAARLASEWARDAQFEHASIASFGRFALELLAVGAPSELVESAHRAAIDEIEHARLCFSLASVYGGEAIGPGPLPLSPSAFAPTTLDAMVRAAVLEGCVNETLAAIEAKISGVQAEPGVVRAALATIERQESDHAALAFRFVGWAIASSGRATRAAARSAFVLAGERMGPQSAVDIGDEPLERELARHGRLGSRARQELRARAWSEVIAPAARALLD